MRNKFVPPEPLRPIRRMGSLACSTLAPGSRGNVVAATSSAIYLASTNDDLIWLATEDVTLHRRGVQVAGPLPRLAPGAPYAVVGRRLDLGPRLAFDLSGAAAWHVAPLCRERILPLSLLATRLSSAELWLARLPGPAGFGLLLPRILGYLDTRPRPQPITETSPILQRAWKAIRGICTACLADDHPEALIGAQKLVGLGEGLTPSGDDFVGGLLYSLQRLRGAYAGLGPMQPQDLRQFLRNARPLTNLISYTLLADHACGHASDALHRFVDALVTGRDRVQIERLAGRLVRVGHSTGWDLLTGVMVGVSSTCGAYSPHVPGEVRAARFLQT
jgi:hypothetical protein